MATHAGSSLASVMNPPERTAVIQRTANGVAHITAADFESLAYGVAYAHAQDNICQTADHLVTVRGERSASFGGTATGLLGLRTLSNEQVDFFVAAHMDDARLAEAWAQTSPDIQSTARGYVAGYNRFLSDHERVLPAACLGKDWVRPMTLRDYYRATEITAIQAGSALLADAILDARPPIVKSSMLSTEVDLADASQAMRDMGLLDPPMGSNAWAFGKDTTGTGRGILLGNPHFPWVGTNRFWQMHITIPGKLDAMGVAYGLNSVVQIGFNKDVAWTHTVSSGSHFTLHELSLSPANPTVYLIDGKPEKMTARKLSIQSRQADGKMLTRDHTLWQTRFGPVLSVPRAGLGWTTSKAYAVQEANTANVRMLSTWLDFNRASNVLELREGMRGLGLPFVTTVAADRHGNAMFADASAVPDVDAAQLQRCAPSQAAAALLDAGLVILNGSRGDCDWRRDAGSAVPGLTPLERMPIAIRSDWVHNSNDSYFYTHPEQKWGSYSPLIGDDVVRRPRTRSGLIEVPELVARGKVTMAGVQRQLFENRNLMARMVLPDLLALCEQAPNAEAREGCTALRGWNRTNELDAGGAPLFREFWRAASNIQKVHRLPFDRAHPVETPAGLNMSDPDVAKQVWAALTNAVRTLRTSGFSADATLGQTQRPAFTEEAIFLHGGDEFEGVLNKVGDPGAPGMTARGLRIDYGASYLQTVTFDERGPVAQAILTYGQSTNPGSPHQADQLKLFARKEWPSLPFHAADVAKQQLGDAFVLRRP
ncbi:MAG: penicillin acylase family protein [Betaproteobacteria bacterium]